MSKVDKPRIQENSQVKFDTLKKTIKSDGELLSFYEGIDLSMFLDVDNPSKEDVAELQALVDIHEGAKQLSQPAFPGEMGKSGANAMLIVMGKQMKEMLKGRISKSIRNGNSPREALKTLVGNNS